MKKFRLLISLVMVVGFLSSCIKLPEEQKESTVAVSGVTSTISKKDVPEGKSFQLFVQIEPDNATNQKVTWKSFNESIAKVDQEGNVTTLTGQKGNNVVIEVTSDDGGKTYQFTINVVEAVIDVDSIIVTPAPLVVPLGQKRPLLGEVVPETATNPTLYWHSKDESIAAVNKLNGLVTGLKAGTTQIVASNGFNRDADKAITVTVQPAILATGLTLSQEDLKLPIGSKARLTVIVEPSNARSKEVSWNSENPSIATVSKYGTVTASNTAQVGQQTYIVAKTTDSSNIVKKVLVTITKEPIDINSIVVTPKRLELDIANGGNNSADLEVTFDPINTTQKDIAWTSSDPAKVTVDEHTGKVTAKAVTGTGQAVQITAIVKKADGIQKVTSVCEVQVFENPVKPTGISIFPPALMAIEKGKMKDTLTATITPNNASDKRVIWVSDDPTIATVDQNGNITVTGWGSTNIWAMTGNGEYIAYSTLRTFEYDTSSATDHSIALAEFPSGVSTSSLQVPMGFDDSSTKTITQKFAIGKTEVTYMLWKAIYDWATIEKDGKRAADSGTLYKFQNPGMKGGYGKNASSPNIGSAKQPVTKVNYRDAIVWSNAYTEWYNIYVAKPKGQTELTFAYVDSSNQPLRDATNTTACDSVNNKNISATGFRLPTYIEWEFAARWIRAGTCSGTATNMLTQNGNCFTNGKSLSGGSKVYSTQFHVGSTDAELKNADVVDAIKYSWFFANSFLAKPQSPMTREVAKLQPNQIGAYDMSGNVWEIVDTVNGESGNRKHKGGSWSSGDYSTRPNNASTIELEQVQLGYNKGMTNDQFWYDLGFRVARTIP